MTQKVCVSSTDIEVLLAVLAVHETDGRATVKSVGIEARQRCKSTTHWHLRRLREAGLIDRTEGQQGTLRPLVHRVTL